MQYGYRIKFEIGEKYRDDLIKALHESEEKLKEKVMGVQVIGRSIITEKDIIFELIYPIPVNNTMFKFIAFRELKKKLKKIDKKAKASYKEFKIKDEDET